MHDLIGVFFSFVFVFFLIGISEALRIKGLVNPAITRKFIHIGVGHWIFFARVLIDSGAWALLPPATFVGINYLSGKKRIFKAMEGNSSSSLGTVFYALSLLILVFLFWGEGNFIYLAAGIMVMAWGDGLAAMVGKKWGKRRIPVIQHVKTWVGSLVMLVTSFIILVLILIFSFSQSPGEVFYISLLTALGATILEALFRSGWDNLFVPLGTALLLFFLVGG